MRFEGKVAVVLPGTFGIGHEMARGFAAEGAKVLVAGLSEKNGRRTADEIAAAGGKAIFVRADPIVESDVKAAVDVARSFWGRVDIAIGTPNDARPGLCHETTSEDFDLAMRFNARSLFNLGKHAIAAMLENREPAGGALVFLASIYGFVSGSVSVGHEVSKTTAVALGKALGERYASKGVRVNVIAAGHVRARERGLEWEFGDDTVKDEAEAKRLAAFYPAGRIAEPEEIVRAAMFLASDEASFVNASVLHVDGGFLAR
jgi:NAD(P)-dependent dehydrogenase (short-subunit alcohol dehydrogenase family)